MKRFLFICWIALLSGCSASIEDYPDNEKDFDLFDYFDGKVVAYGMVQDYQGKLTRRFNVDIVGEIEGNQLTLTEDFVFDDGEIQQRIWIIEKLSENHYRGTADDVVGFATGIVKGPALNWRYILSMDVDGSNYHINFDDWMFLQDEKRLFNRAKMTKWGIEVGQVTLLFEKI